MQTQDEALKLKSPEEVISEYNDRLKQEGILSPSDFVDFEFIELQENQSRLRNVKILQCFQEDTTKTHRENWTENNPNYGQQYLHKDVTTVQKRTFALLGKSASKVIEESGTFISQLLSERQELRDEVKKLEKETEESKAEAARKQHGLSELQRDYDRKHEQLMSAKGNAMKYESDMAKISKAIGERTLNEILGDSK